jgi:hypothetical protein
MKALEPRVVPDIKLNKQDLLSASQSRLLIRQGGAAVMPLGFMWPNGYRSNTCGLRKAFKASTHAILAIISRFQPILDHG